MINENIVEHLERLSKTDPDWPALKIASAYFKNIPDSASITHAKERVESVGNYIDLAKNEDKRAIDIGSNFGITHQLLNIKK